MFVTAVCVLFLIIQTVLLYFFFSFYFLNALHDDNSNKVYVLMHKYILASLRAHFQVNDG